MQSLNPNKKNFVFSVSFLELNKYSINQVFTAEEKASGKLMLGCFKPYVHSRNS